MKIVAHWEGKKDDHYYQFKTEMPICGFMYIERCITMIKDMVNSEILSKYITEVVITLIELKED